METAKRLLGFCKTLKDNKPQNREELESKAGYRGYNLTPEQIDAMAAMYVVKGGNK
jgi:hypothetical protein